jgi:hypothetical protein
MRIRPPTAARWTDANESDPGITLLGLFAFLGEALTYSRRATRRRKLAVAALVLVALWKLRSDRAE